MCQCSSCEPTDTFAKRSFAEWPRGNPAGAKAKTEYATHRAYCLKWGGGREPAIPPSVYERDPFPCKGTSFVAPKFKIPQPNQLPRVPTVAEYVETFIAINKLRTEAP